MREATPDNSAQSTQIASATTQSTRLISVHLTESLCNIVNTSLGWAFSIPFGLNILLGHCPSLHKGGVNYFGCVRRLDRFGEGYSVPRIVGFRRRRHKGGDKF